jgi:hypothetical protein
MVRTRAVELQALGKETAICLRDLDLHEIIDLQCLEGNVRKPGLCREKHFAGLPALDKAVAELAVNFGNLTLYLHIYSDHSLVTEAFRLRKT